MRSDRGFTALLVTAVGLVLIAGGQLIGNRMSVEDDLATRSSAALDRAGLAAVSVSFSGRDARLSGPAADLQMAAGIVRSLLGVRVVDTESGSTQPPASDAPPGRP